MSLFFSCFKVDLVGGYYDAGDNIKFGLPMAFTTTMLAWSIIEFGDDMKAELENAKAALRWGTDYLLQAATTTPGTLYVQVRPCPFVVIDASSCCIHVACMLLLNFHLCFRSA